MARAGWVSRDIRRTDREERASAWATLKKIILYRQHLGQNRYGASLLDDLAPVLDNTRKDLAHLFPVRYDSHVAIRQHGLKPYPFLDHSPQRLYHLLNEVVDVQQPQAVSFSSVGCRKGVTGAFACLRVREHPLDVRRERVIYFHFGVNRLLMPCHRLRHFFKMEDRVCSDFF